jgi:hypothetical protein
VRIQRSKSEHPICIVGRRRMNIADRSASKLGNVAAALKAVI